MSFRNFDEYSTGAPTSLVLGHRGLVGQALMRKLPHARIEDIDLRTVTPTILPSDDVYLAAGRVGGIGENSDQPADMIADNLAIQTNVIQACTKVGARLLFLGSSCIYPRYARQPIRETDLLSGPLEPTNSAYAMAKLCGLEMCRSYAKQHGLRYVALMPCNLYGYRHAGDTHVLPMLMRRIHDAAASGAERVTVWGTGRPLREFMHAYDLADAAVHMMSVPGAEGQVINVGTGVEVSIHELATLLAKIIGYDGEIEFDPSKPDGTPRKVLDLSLATSLGWSAKIPLEQGLLQTYGWFKEHNQ